MRHSIVTLAFKFLSVLFLLAFSLRPVFAQENSIQLPGLIGEATSTASCLPTETEALQEFVNGLRAEFPIEGKISRAAASLAGGHMVPGTPGGVVAGQFVKGTQAHFEPGPLPAGCNGEPKPLPAGEFLPHIRVACSNLKQPNIFFVPATTDQDKIFASQALSIIGAAHLSGKSLKIVFSLSDNSGDFLGCPSIDCRRILAVSMEGLPSQTH